VAGSGHRYKRFPLVPLVPRLLYRRNYPSVDLPEALEPTPEQFKGDLFT